LNSDLSFVLFLRGAVLTFDYTDTPYCSCFWISASQLYSKVISFFAHSKHCLIGGASLDCWGVQAALEHLLQRTDIDPKRIFVFGRSLGGAVGSALTRRNPGKVSGLILENTFTSVLDMAGVMLPPLRFFVGGPGNGKGPKLLNWLVKSPWRTIDLVTDISEPVLFLSGLKDEMVPPSHMRRLYIAAQRNSGYRSFVEFPHGMHMDTWMRGGEHYWKSIESFMKQHTAGETTLQNSPTEVDGGPQLMMKEG
jgi:pimeloyl-ACP methyl ester carboxylesterase